MKQVQSCFSVGYYGQTLVLPAVQSGNSTGGFIFYHDTNSQKHTEYRR